MVSSPSEPLSGEIELHRSAVGGEAGDEQVHRRRADEPGDEHVRRLVVELLRRVDLLQDAAFITATR